MIKEVKDLQWRFHQTDPLKQKKEWKELMKEYNKLNSELIAKGHSLQELELMYAEAESSFDSDDSEQISFALTSEDYEKIVSES